MPFADLMPRSPTFIVVVSVSSFWLRVPLLFMSYCWATLRNASSGKCAASIGTLVSAAMAVVQGIIISADANAAPMAPMARRAARGLVVVFMSLLLLFLEKTNACITVHIDYYSLTEKRRVGACMYCMEFIVTWFSIIVKSVNRSCVAVMCNTVYNNTHGTTTQHETSRRATQSQTSNREQLHE